MTSIQKFPKPTELIRLSSLPYRKEGYWNSCGDTHGNLDIGVCFITTCGRFLWVGTTIDGEEAKGCAGGDVGSEEGEV
jgi:hypothetical protein